jgi:EamA domain-containing membrane protein RarD
MKLPLLNLLTRDLPRSDRLLFPMSGISTILTMLLFLASQHDLPFLIPIGVAGLFGSVMTMLLGFWELTGDKACKRIVCAVLLATITVLATVFSALPVVRH